MVEKWPPRAQFFLTKHVVLSKFVFVDVFLLPNWFWTLPGGLLEGPLRGPRGPNKLKKSEANINLMCFFFMFLYFFHFLSLCTYMGTWGQGLKPHPPVSLVGPGPPGEPKYSKGVAIRSPSLSKGTLMILYYIEDYI